MAKKSAKMTNVGSMKRPATKRGMARNRTGSMARVSRASICSVTRIVPSSAAMDEPTRPATTRAVSAGPSSMKTALLTPVPKKIMGTYSFI